MSKIRYSQSEQTDKKYTVNQAIDAATLVLDDKRVEGVCMTAVRHLDRARAITLVELNKLSDQIVTDSLYYA